MLGLKHIPLFALLAGFALLNVGIWFAILTINPGYWTSVAWADETSEKSESNEGSESSENSYEDEEAPEEVTPQYVTRYRTITKVITVTDPGYDIDTDGDVIVDAIDPDPARHQEEYFTDYDGDSIPNAFDLYHDEDDFAYFESAVDNDHDGIIDSLEQE